MARSPREGGGQNAAWRKSFTDSSGTTASKSSRQNQDSSCAHKGENHANRTNFAYGAQIGKDTMRAAKDRTEPLAEVLEVVFKHIEAVTPEGDNAQRTWTKMAEERAKKPELRKELSHLGAVSVSIQELRALALRALQ